MNNPSERNVYDDLFENLLAADAEKVKALLKALSLRDLKLLEATVDSLKRKQP